MIRFLIFVQFFFSVVKAEISCIYHEENSEAISIMFKCHELVEGSYDGYEGQDFHGTTYFIHKRQFISYKDV